MDNQRSGHYVAKLAQRFFDVRTAADKDLVFSSEFPLLKEEATGIIDTSTLGPDFDYYPIYNHGLGYHPFFIFITEDAGISFRGAVDSNYVYMSPSAGLRYRWIVYRLPLYRSFESPVSNNLSVQNDNDSNLKFKFAKNGKNINSTDLRDFTIHSDTMSPIVHAVNFKEPSTSDFFSTSIGDLWRHIVEVNLPYEPLVFAFGEYTHEDFGNSLHGKSVPIMGSDTYLPPTLRATPEEITVEAPKAMIRTSIIQFKDQFLSNIINNVIY